VISRFAPMFLAGLCLVVASREAHGQARQRTTLPLLDLSVLNGPSSSLPSSTAAALPATRLSSPAPLSRPLPSSRFAQPLNRTVQVGESDRGPSRMFINVDFVDLFPSDQGQSYRVLQPVAAGQATTRVAYAELPTLYTIVPTVTFTMGRVRTSSVGLAFDYLQARYETVAALALTVPSPIFGSISDTGFSAILDRQDTMLDLGAHYTYSDGRWRLVFRAGPTYFRTTADTVRDVLYGQAPTSDNSNSVTLTSGPPIAVKGSTWGFNFGGDASYFVWRHVGLGGGLHFNRGRIQVDGDPFTGGTSSFDVGTTRLQGGLRFRF
jgi:hypothetical protein